jgi:hypothetical protein
VGSLGNINLVSTLFLSVILHVTHSASEVCVEPAGVKLLLRHYATARYSNFGFITIFFWLYGYDDMASEELEVSSMFQVAYFNWVIIG